MTEQAIRTVIYFTTGKKWYHTRLGVAIRVWHSNLIWSKQ